jgi:hypothetical protein
VRVQSIDTIASFKASVNKYPAIELGLGPSSGPLVLYREAQLRRAALVALHVEVQIADLGIHHIFAYLHPFWLIMQLIPFRKGINQQNTSEVVNRTEISIQLRHGVEH